MRGSPTKSLYDAGIQIPLSIFWRGDLVSYDLSIRNVFGCLPAFVLGLGPQYFSGFGTNLGLFRVTVASGTLENFAWKLFKKGNNENVK